MTDYEILMDVKTTPDNESDSWPRLQLWNRYQPVVYKRARHLMTIVRSKYEIEDIVQEFFISFNDAVDYVDFEKIPSESFKFGTILFYFLRKKERSIRTHYFKMKKKEKDNPFNYTPADVTLEDIESPSTFKEDTILFQKIQLPQFRKMLNKSEMILFRYYLKENVPKLTEIAAKEEMSYAKVRRLTKQISKKARKHFGDFNYVL